MDWTERLVDLALGGVALTLHGYALARFRKYWDGR